MRHYLVAVAAVYALSVSWMAGMLVSRSSRLAAAGFLPVYTALLAAVAAVAVAIVRPPTVLDTAPAQIVLGVPLGLGLGAAVAGSETWLRPRTVRRSTGSGGRLRARHGGGMMFVRTGQAPALALLLTVAVLEEVLFRGVLLQLVSELGPAAAALGCVGLVLAFALIHLPFGWTAVALKAPLGVATLAATLAAGSIVPAVIAHGFVNFRSWQSLAERHAVPQATPGQGEPWTAH